MNAYELADELDKIHDIRIETIINMLRQQADRIAELEDRLSMYEIKDLDKPQIHCEPLCKPTVCDCFKKASDK